MSIENVLLNVERQLQDNHYYIDQEQLNIYKEELIKSVLQGVKDLSDYNIVRFFMIELLAGIECKKLSSVIEELQQIVQRMHRDKANEEVVFVILDEYNQVGNFKSMTFFTALMLHHYAKISGQSPHVMRISLETSNDFQQDSSLEGEREIGLPNKKIVFLLFDDISYSGTQIEKISKMIYGETKHIKNKEIRFCFSRMFVDSVKNIVDYQVRGNFYCYRVVPNLPFIKLDDFDYIRFYKDLKRKASDKVFEVSPNYTWHFPFTEDINSFSTESKMTIIRHLQVIRIFQYYENTFPINTKFLFLEYKIPSFISVNQFIISGMILNTGKFDSLPIANKNIHVIERTRMDPNNVQKLQRMVDSNVITKIPFVFIKHQPLSRADIKPDFSYDGNISNYAKNVTFYKSMKNIEKISKYLDDKSNIVSLLKPLPAPVASRKREREKSNNDPVRSRTLNVSSLSSHNAAPNAPTNAFSGAAPSSGAHEFNIDEFLRQIPYNPSHRDSPDAFREYRLLGLTDPFPPTFRTNHKES